nr:TPA_inf: RNA-dependent RNA polymerase [Beta vulgaris mitovirus 1]
MLFDLLIKIRALPWQKTMESLRIMCGLFSRVQLIILDGLTKEFSIASYLFAKQVIRIGKKSGWLFLALYLKQCNAVLMQYRGSSGPVDRNLSVPVSLSRSGLPIIIPSFHRKVIMCRNERSDVVIQFYLSLFSINRMIPLAKKVSKDTFQSIITPPHRLDTIQTTSSELKTKLKMLFKRYLPHVDRIPLKQGMRFEPTWKALPTSKIVQSVLVNRLKVLDMKAALKIKSCFLSLPYELAGWTNLVEFVHAGGEQWSQGALWRERVRYPFDCMNKTFTGSDIDWFEEYKGPRLPTCKRLGIPPTTGRLSCSFPGAGKRRIFAIGNYVNQRLLKPVHDWVMSVLRSLPQDGTYNQTRPLKSLVGQMKCFSYDLSSATDRWPLLIMFEMFQVCFDRGFASAVVNSALATNIFQVPFTRRRHSSVCFVAGQPLGYYSSWALFSLSHHLIVWLAAEEVYPGKRFTNYAVLGDDVIITDDKVAPIYTRYVEWLGVKISYLKSIISTTGCIEFAKRFLVDGLRKDLSPISIKALANYFHPYGMYAIHTKYRFRRFSTFCRVGGVGYKGLSRLSNLAKAPRNIRRRKAMWDKATGLPISWWLGCGKPLNPYITGFLIELLRKELKPKDLVLAPESFFEGHGAKEFQEITLVHNWVKCWLQYLKWYCLVALSPDVTIEQLFADVPVVTTHWNVRQTNEELVRFGILWKCYDKVTSLGLDWCPGALPESAGPLCGWILGGYSGSDFIVLSCGLEQPAPRKGVVKYGGSDNSSVTTPNKTLGVAERQLYVAYHRCYRNGTIVVI